MGELMLILIIIMGQLLEIANVCRWSKMFFFKRSMEEEVV